MRADRTFSLILQRIHGEKAASVLNETAWAIKLIPPSLVPDLIELTCCILFRWGLCGGAGAVFLSLSQYFMFASTGLCVCACVRVRVCVCVCVCVCVRAVI